MLPCARATPMTFHYCKPWVPMGCMAAEGSTTSKLVFGLAGLALGVMLGLVVFALVLLPLARRVLDAAAARRFTRVGFRIATTAALLLALAAAAGTLAFGAWLASVLALAAFAVLFYAAFGLRPDGTIGGGPVAASVVAMLFGLAAWGFLVW